MTATKVNHNNKEVTSSTSKSFTTFVFSIPLQESDAHALIALQTGTLRTRVYHALKINCVPSAARAASVVCWLRCYSSDTQTYGENRDAAQEEWMNLLVKTFSFYFVTIKFESRVSIRTRTHTHLRYCSSPFLISRQVLLLLIYKRICVRVFFLNLYFYIDRSVYILTVLFRLPKNITKHKRSTLLFLFYKNYRYTDTNE